MNLSRQIDTLPKTVLKSKVTVIGAGGIGSWTVLGLSKLGFENIEVFDDDEIEDVNIPSQVFSHKQIGKKKVTGLNDLCALLADTQLTTHETKFTECKTSVLIVAVDNMKTRKQVAEGLRDGKLFADFVIDARMAIESGIIQPYSFSTVKKYLETLYTDEEAVQEACTNRAISYTTMIIGGLICKTIISYLKDESSLSTNFNLKHSETEKPEFVLFSKDLRVARPTEGSLPDGVWVASDVHVPHPTTRPNDAEWRHMEEHRRLRGVNRFPAELNGHLVDAPQYATQLLNGTEYQNMRRRIRGQFEPDPVLPRTVTQAQLVRRMGELMDRQLIEAAINPVAFVQPSAEVNLDMTPGVVFNYSRTQDTLDPMSVSRHEPDHPNEEPGRTPPDRDDSTEDWPY